MDYLIFKASNKKTGDEVLYLYNEAVNGNTESQNTKRVHYCHGVIERSLKADGLPSEDYEIFTAIESYRTIGVHIQNFRFIEPIAVDESNKFIYRTPTYPVLDRTSFQPNKGWLLSKVSRLTYSKEN